MSRLIRLFSVFISSPGDVKDERSRIKGIVSRINASFLRRYDALLNPILWERDVFSSKGTDLQDVVNQEVGDSYDVYLGIIWSRLGTETPRALSGTLEEFDRALDRYKSGDRNLRFMFFVREGGYPDGVDPSQLKAVQRFRRRLTEEGLLVKPYDSPETFETIAYEHLNDYLQQQVAINSAGTKVVPRNLVARAQTLIPDIGQRLVEGARELKTLSQKSEAQSLLRTLEIDLRRLDNTIADIERQAALDDAALARDIVFGEVGERTAIAKRIAGTLSEIQTTQKKLCTWHEALLKLEAARDLGEPFRLHINKVVATADRLISAASCSHEHLSKLRKFALSFPQPSARRARSSDLQ